MIIFMGVAGSGKSLQGRMLADNLGLPWLSTGEFLRMLVTGSVRKEMLSGKLLEDKHIIALVQQVLELVETSENFVLDGFPRTVNQTEWLLSQVKYEQLRVDAIVHLTASKEVVMERLLSRGRVDDSRQAIADRINEFEDTAKDIIDRFKKADIPVIDIKSEGDIHRIHQEIVAALEGVPGCIPE